MQVPKYFSKLAFSIKMTADDFFRLLLLAEPSTDRNSITLNERSMDAMCYHTLNKHHYGFIL
jgi:hypothetical protein